MQLAHLNWQEAEKVLADPETLVVIPVGSTEQHGSVGPLGTDWLCLLYTSDAADE